MDAWIKRLVASVLATLLAVTVAAAPPAAALEPVELPDPALRACVTAALGLAATDPIPPAAAAGLTTLTCSEWGTGKVADLTGIGSLSALTALSLPNHAVRDLSPLTSLGSLRRLTAPRNPFTDASPLTQLPLLEELDLATTGMTDLSFVPRLTALRALGITGTSPASYEPLRSLSGLQHLSVDATIDWSILVSLPQLRWLGLRGTGTARTLGVASLPKVDTLVISNMAHASLTDWPELPNLVYLTDIIDGLTSLEGIAKYPKLESVHLSQVPIGSLAPLADLPLLRDLLVDTGPFTSLDGLDGLSRLQTLSLYRVPLTDTNALAHLTQLSSLTLSWCGLTRVPEVANLTSLTSIDLFGNKIRDLSPLQGTTATISAGGQDLALTPAYAGEFIDLGLKDVNGHVITPEVEVPDASVGVTRDYATGEISIDTPGRYTINFHSLTFYGSGLQDITPSAAFTSVVGAPSITGTPGVGYTLTASHPTTEPTADSWRYQWYRLYSFGGNPAVIEGATSSSYTVTSTDVGHQVRVAVTAIKKGYLPVTTQSPATATVVRGLLQGPTPVITGLAKTGATLTANPGVWTPPSARLTYQWYRETTKISGATSPTYAPTSADLGQRLRVAVTGAATGLVGTLRKVSAYTAQVTRSNFTSAPTPLVTVTARTDQVLTGDPGIWGPAPVTLAYQWQRDGANISGATALTYQLTPADVGHYVRLRVRGSKPDYATKYRYSASRWVSKASFATTPTPAIVGTPAVGNRLTSNVGTWDPTPSSFRYQWYRDATAIDGATSSGYTLTRYDRGHTIKVRVRAYRSGYDRKTVFSAATTTIQAGTLTAPIPTITGSPAVGGTLLGTAGTWGPGSVALSYRWFRDGLAITGASSTTYRVVSADVGHALTFAVTGSKSGYTTTSRTSDPLAVA